jgi:hypothetical protein
MSDCVCLHQPLDGNARLTKESAGQLAEHGADLLEKKIYQCCGKKFYLTFENN